MWQHWSILVAIGMTAGVCSGLFGIGGGVIIVPLLGLLFGLSSQVASATSLVAMLAPVGILGVLHYHRAGVLTTQHFQFGAWIALGLLFGAWIGANWATSISSGALQKMFAVFLVLVAIRLWLKA